MFDCLFVESKFEIDNRMRAIQHTIHYKIYDNESELNQEDVDLLTCAKKAMQNAYAPYSKFQVGAAALLANGEVVMGSNQENIAYPSGLCAERTALFAAGSNFPNEKVLKIAIVAEGDLLPKTSVLSPCGSCRQVMAETSNRQKSTFEILLLNPNGSITVFNGINDLLPFGFGN
jgi:cytidine deaminase